MGNKFDDLEKLAKYMNAFEKKVMIPCFEKRIASRTIAISSKRPKLLNTEFGKVIGPSFESNHIVAFNYYGLNKVSSGFQEKVKKLGHDGVDARSIKSAVIYFAAIRAKEISRFAPELAADFPIFKEKLVSLRNFKSGQEPVEQR